jgi:CheY-like chemotaxis protein
MVSKRLIELMKGEIGVESTVGVGSVFWIEVKLTDEPKRFAGAAELTPVHRAHVQADAQVRTLLYVEDNPANMKLVEQLIERCPDMQLLTAVNGTIGIKLARATWPEVILMDINLPGISGIEAMKILREDPTTAHIPVVGRTAQGKRSAPMPCRATSRSGWKPDSSATSRSPSRSPSLWRP